MWYQASFAPCAPSYWHPGQPLRLYSFHRLIGCPVGGCPLPRAFEAIAPQCQLALPIHVLSRLQSMRLLYFSLGCPKLCWRKKGHCLYTWGCSSHSAHCPWPMVPTGDDVWTTVHILGMQWLQPKEWLEDVLFYVYTVKFWQVNITWSENKLLFIFSCISQVSLALWSFSIKPSNSPCWTESLEASIHTWYNGWCSIMSNDVVDIR